MAAGEARAMALPALQTELTRRGSGILAGQKVKVESESLPTIPILIA